MSAFFRVNVALVLLFALSAFTAAFICRTTLEANAGREVLADLRRRYGSGLPAILVTADRTAAVREAANAQDIQVLNKPIKPAALRALLAQWRVQRVAAAE